MPVAVFVGSRSWPSKLQLLGTASAVYAVQEADVDSLHTLVREVLITTFGTVYSKSIQLSMRAMADAVFSAHEMVDSITLTFPNLHHFQVDASPFGIENDYAVFIPSREPHSLIQANFRR